jgi:hypothetical protein
MTQPRNRYGALGVALAAAVGVVFGVVLARVAGKSPTAMPG